MMTDNDIIKAFEYCFDKNDGILTVVNNGEQNIITVGDVCKVFARQKAEKEALIAGQETLQKYIAEQKAEIERLKDILIKLRELHDRTKPLLSMLPEEIERYKVESIKEFAERLKNKLTSCSKTIDGESEYHICDYDIDNLVKEMVGDGNDT